MTRVAIAFFLVAVVAVGALALAGEPGRASLEWMGWRVEMTAAAASAIAAEGRSKGPSKPCGHST